MRPEPRALAAIAAAFLFAATASSRLWADAAGEARIDGLIVKDVFENGWADLSSKEGLRRLYEEAAAIDPEYWRTYYLKMLYEDLVAEDRAGLLRALDTANEAWGRFASDEANLLGFKENLVPRPADSASEGAWRSFFDRLKKQSDAMGILALKANVYEAMDERESAREALDFLLSSGNLLARYEALSRTYWLRLKYLTLKEGSGLIDEIDGSLAEVEADLGKNQFIDAPYVSSYKHTYRTSFMNERALLWGYTYDIQRAIDGFDQLIGTDRDFFGSMGWSYGENEVFASNLQLLRLSNMDWAGLDANHREDARTYAYLQAKHEALLSRGRPAEARGAIQSSTADRRYLTEGMRRLFLGQASLLAGDASAAVSHLEYAAGYKEVFRDISYTLGNYQARVYSELVSAYRAQRAVRKLEGKPAVLSLPLRAKEFYYRFLLLSNLRSNPDYLTLFSPFMVVRDMSMSPYAAMETMRELDPEILGRKMEDLESMDRRPGAAKYYSLARAEVALSSGDRKAAAALLAGDPEGADDYGISTDERLYLAMAFDARARLAASRRDEKSRQDYALATFRAYPGYAVGRGQRLALASPIFTDATGTKEGKDAMRRIRKAAAKWNVSWKKNDPGLPRPAIELAAEGSGAELRYRLTVSLIDPAAASLAYAAERGPKSTLVYPQDIKKGGYPSWVLRAIFGVEEESITESRPGTDSPDPPALELPGP